MQKMSNSFLVVHGQCIPESKGVWKNSRRKVMGLRACLYKGISSFMSTAKCMRLGPHHTHSLSSDRILEVKRADYFPDVFWICPHDVWQPLLCNSCKPGWQIVANLPLCQSSNIHYVTWCRKWISRVPTLIVERKHHNPW